MLPGVIVFGCGLSLTVAPLTATVLGAAPEQYAGVASAVNNDVARTAGLIAVAVLPPLAGISNADFGNPVDFSDGFHLAMIIAGVTLMAGGAARLGDHPPPAARRRTADAGPHLALRARRAPPPRRLRRGHLTRLTRPVLASLRPMRRK